MPPTRPGLPSVGPNGSLLPLSVSTPGGTTVAPVLSMSSQPGGQIGAPHVTSVTGTSGPLGSQPKPCLIGQVIMTYNRILYRIAILFFCIYSVFRNMDFVSIRIFLEPDKSISSRVNGRERRPSTITK